MPTIPRPTCWSRSPTKHCRSRRRDRAALLLAALTFLGAAIAQPLVVPSKPPQCQSVVVVRCDPVESADAPPQKERAQRLDERRRAPLDGVELDRIVIEADPVRPGLADVMSRPFASRPMTGTRTFVTGEGSQCTCMNRCPPIPFPCCDCSSPMDAYSRTPGGFSPLR